jgi:hypothetical protein
MRRTAAVVGPYRIVKRRNHFKVRLGDTNLASFDKFLDAEDYALRAWLQNSHNDNEDEPDSSGRKIARASFMAAPTSRGWGDAGRLGPHSRGRRAVPNLQLKISLTIGPWSHRTRIPLGETLRFFRFDDASGEQHAPPMRFCR